MEYRNLELTLVSGRDIGPGSSTGRPEAYAEVSLKGTRGSRHKSKVDREGGTNPTWNLTLTLTMEDFYVQEPGVEVVVKLYYERIEEDMLVGKVKIPIHILFGFGYQASGSAAFNVAPTGSLTISHRLGKKRLMPKHSFPTSKSAFPLLPILQRLPSGKLFSPEAEDSGEEEEDSDKGDTFKKWFEKYSKREDLSSNRRGRYANHYKTYFSLFCSVFPLDYEFTKDVLKICQWVAGGLTELEEDDEMEEVYMKECVDTLVVINYIKPSGYDYVLDQTKYKIGDRRTTFLQSQLLEPRVGKYLDSNRSHHDPSKIELLSLTFKETGHAVLKQYSRMHTLVIHNFYEVDHLPSDIFSELKALKILILSRTNIVELPKSVENLKELLFLDMSETPLLWLPETIRCFTQLQTLRLDGCLQLEGLPEGTSNLINLRHLIIDVVRQLESMPVGIGNLSNLRTLSAFLVGEEGGCSVAELRNMNKLRGTFRLLNLENVETVKEASEACLCEKVDLKKIELKWSDIEDDKITPAQEGILESLQPPVGIQELKILFYSGGMLPSWICDPSFNELVTIFLYKCRYCISLPSLGELPSLKHLSIIENNVVVEIDNSFCRKQRNQHHPAFPKLEKLTFESMSRLKKWTCLDEFDFPSLQHLIIEYCPKFEGLPLLSHLHSLSHLEIRYCPKLSFSPNDKFPPSLRSLMIKESEILKKWCRKRKCSKIARVPTVYFDHQKFTREM